jgi:hypothetical protein
MSIIFTHGFYRWFYWTRAHRRHQLLASGGHSWKFSSANRSRRFVCVDWGTLWLRDYSPGRRTKWQYWTTPRKSSHYRHILNQYYVHAHQGWSSIVAGSLQGKSLRYYLLLFFFFSLISFV